VPADLATDPDAKARGRTDQELLVRGRLYRIAAQDGGGEIRLVEA